MTKVKRIAGCMALLTLAGLVLFPSAWVAWWCLEPLYENYSNRIPFDSGAWKDGELDRSMKPVRLCMVDDLLKRNELVGMSKAEIDQLLGKPTETEKFSDYDYVYWLGPERGFIRIDSEWLAFKFQDNRVVEARVVRD